MADNSSKAYKEALKQIDNMVKKQEALKKSTQALEGSWSAVASEIFKMDGASFFKNVEKSPEQLRAMGKEVQQLEEGFRNLGENFNKTLGDNQKFQYVKKSLQGIGEEFKNSSKKINDSIRNSFSEVYKGLDEDLKGVIKSEADLEKILKNKDKLTDKQKDKLKGFEKFQELEKKHQELSDQYQKDLVDKLNTYKKTNSELSTMNQEMVDKVIERIALGEDEVKIAEELGEEGRKVLASLSGSKDELLEINKGMTGAAEQIKNIREESQKMNKEFSLSKGLVNGLGSMFSGLGSIIKKDWIDSIMKFDSVLNDVQKNTGINMDANSESFARLQTNVAQFGMSVEGAGKMMESMSNELRTTDFNVLAKATQDFAAIEGATGLSADNIANISGEMMRMGQSSEQVKDFMEGASKEAQKFGVSSKRALEGISKNIKKMREMGFVGGEKSLTKMVITAERLKMNIDETFDMAKRARSIEGAMDMAAELQLAGGSFANINPMDLLAAARKGPEELQKILTKMGGDIGRFDEKTGKMVFDPVDVDRLQMVSDATGQSMESLQNMISTNAQDMQKLEPFQGMLDGMDEAEASLAKSALSDMMKFDEKTGKFVIDADNDLAKKMGIDSLDDINQDTIQGMLKQKDEDAKTLEEQNKRNQSLKQAFDNFIQAIMSVFSALQPFIEMLTTAIQFVAEIFTTVMNWLPGWGKMLLGGLLLFGAMFGTSVGAFITQGIGGFIKGVASFGKSALDFMKNIANPDMWKGIGGKVKGAFGMGGAAATGGGKDAVAGALGKGNDIAGDKSMTPAAGAQKKGFLMGLADGIKEFGKVKWGDLLKFAAALAIIGVAIIGFGFAMASIGGEAGIGQMVTAAVSLGLMMLAIWGLSIIAKSVDMGGLLKGALALLVVGVALVPFAFAAQMLTGVDLMKVIGALGVLALVVVGLIGLGALLMTPIIGWLLMAGIAALIAIGAGLLLAGTGMLAAATAMEKLGSIDWGGFAEMGMALGGIIMPLIGFSFAAMMFANPIALLGILMMTWALAGLAAVLAPISEALTIGADSLDKFASGLVKLGQAADSLSLEKLEKLKELSDAMANAGSGGAAMAAMAAMANSGAGGKGGDGEVRKIEVDVKMNGRELQNYIVKDTAIVK